MPYSHSDVSVTAVKVLLERLGASFVELPHRLGIPSGNINACCYGYVEEKLVIEKIQAGPLSYFLK
jgi:hypothetical protein